MEATKYLLRNEGTWALKGLPINGVGPNAWEQYVEALSDTLPDAFSSPVAVEVHELLGHMRKMRRVLNGDFTVSLDPCVRGKRQLGISRAFTHGGRVDTGITARPGFASIEAQVSTLPQGQEVTIVEDDIFTGGTMRRILAMLNAKGIRVKKVVVGIKVGTPELDVPVVALDSYQPSEIFDLSDPRDFLVGAHGAGLVVKCDDGELVRAPYLLPFVDVGARCSMSAAAADEFSLRMWVANIHFWERFPRVRVCDIERPQRRFLVREGYDAKATVGAVCRRVLKSMV